MINKECKNDVIEKLKNKLKFSVRKISLLCLYLYLVFIFIGQYMVGVSIDLKTWIIPVLFAGAVPVTCLTDKACQVVLNINMRQTAARSKQILWFLGTFAGTLVVLGMYYYAYFPGAYSPDSDSQLSQAISGKYSDWHPFMHTLLFFTVPMKIFQAEEMIVFLQLLYFSAGLSYLITTIKKYECPWQVCVLSIAFVIFSPVTGNIMMFPWKDCGLAVFAMVTVAHYINIILSQGKWLQKRRNMLVCSLFLSFTVLMRHNAVLFVFPLIIALFVKGWKDYRRESICVAVIFAAIILLIKVPVYRIYQVEKSSDRLTESVGMCMTMMGNVVKKCPELLDDDIRDFLYKVSPREVWQEADTSVGFNEVKWNANTNKAIIEEVGGAKIIGYTFRSFWAAKRVSLQAFLRVTGMVWKLDGDLDWGIGASADTSKTEMAVDTEKQGKVRLLLRNWEKLMGKSILKFPMNYIGWSNLALIALGLTDIGRRRKLSGILHAAPLLCYNFGTSLLLTGLDWRFFYLTFPLTIPIIFLMIKDARGIKE